jgi:hypothetical protein
LKTSFIIHAAVSLLFFVGLCVDLFKEIAKKLDFDYDFYETKDGYFGSLNDDGTWNGAIHELIEKVKQRDFMV